MVFTPEVILETFFIVLQVVPRTLLLAFTILAFGVAFGFLLSLIKIKKIPVVTGIVNILISYARGVPLIVHLLFLQAALPEASASFLSMFGVATDPNEFPNLLIVLFTYIFLEAAIESEYIRGAFQSVDSSQVEAGYSIGFTRSQNLRRIIIPQALAVVVPLFLNSFLKIIKALSLAFTVGVVEILSQARYAAALNYRYLESYIAAALVYWLVCGILQSIFNRVERKMQFN
jgi:ABC-type amino acid transport system permease subunit